MPDSLFNLPPAPPVPCPRCGRVFEQSLELEGENGPRPIVGHPQGDPVLCVPLASVAAIQERDARRRRDKRRGRP